MVARRIGAVLLALTLGGALAACGDDAEAVNDGVGQVEREGDGNDDGNDDSDDDFPDAIFGSEECALAVQALSAFSTIITGVGGDVDPGDISERLDELADEAPEIEGALRTMAASYADFHEAAPDGIDLADPATFTDPDLIAAVELFDTEEFQAATEEVTEFAEVNCTTFGG